MKIKKNAMTLLEVLVAIGLLCGLMLFLLGSYWQVSQINHELKMLRKESFQKRYVGFRLETVLSRARLRKDVAHEKKSDYYFYTSHESNFTLQPGSLVFTFDKGPDVDPDFAGTVMGRLYLDDKKQFCLAIWPLQSKWKNAPPPMRKEILLNNIKSLTFSYFVPPSPAGLTVNPPSIDTNKTEDVDPEPDKWHQEWKQSYKGLPPLVELNLVRIEPNEKEEILTYGFVLQNSTRTILLQ